MKYLTEILAFCKNQQSKVYRKVVKYQTEIPVDRLTQTITT